MVEYTLNLDTIFSTLSDPIRRDIFERVSECELSVSEIAKDYDISMAAVSKHVSILERAKLIAKRKRGKQRLIQATPIALKDADEYLKRYRQMWESRFDKLDQLLTEEGESV